MITRLIYIVAVRILGWLALLVGFHESGQHFDLR